MNRFWKRVDDGVNLIGTVVIWPLLLLLNKMLLGLVVLVWSPFALLGCLKPLPDFEPLERAYSDLAGWGTISVSEIYEYAVDKHGYTGSLDAATRAFWANPRYGIFVRPWAHYVWRIK